MQNVNFILKKALLMLFSLLKNIGALIQAVVNFVLLLPVYLIGIGIVAIVSKVMKKHYLSLEKTKRRTYWLKRDQRLDKEGNEYRMF